MSGKVVGKGEVLPAEAKVSAIKTYPAVQKLSSWITGILPLFCVPHCVLCSCPIDLYLHKAGVNDHSTDHSPLTFRSLFFKFQPKVHEMASVFEVA